MYILTFYKLNCNSVRLNHFFSCMWVHGNTDIPCGIIYKYIYIYSDEDTDGNKHNI